MPAQVDSVMRHLRQSVRRQDAATRTDGQLLSFFIDHRDESAFEALVQRHGPMVLGVCRRLVRNHHDAEDAFQAAFLVLARKASSVRPRERVGNWLHGVALRTAMKARALTAKRRGREKQVMEMPEPEAAQQDPWRDLQPLLDQELNGLPENYRLPILLCDLEGKTIKEATRQLGWPQGTLAARLTRGRKLLAKRLANRGVMLSAGSLAAVVSQNSASAGVPTSLVGSTIKAAMIVAEQATLAGAVPAKVAILMEGVLKSMLLTKLKSVVAVMLAMVTLGIGAGLLASGTAGGQQSNPVVPQGVASNGTTSSAQKNADTAEFYERTGHPKTADFYRQLTGDDTRPHPAPPKAAQQREYVITSRLMEDNAGKVKQVCSLPRITLDEGQGLPSPLHINDEPQNLLAKVIDDANIKVGLLFDVRVKRLGETKARLFLSFQKNELEQASVSEIRVLGNSVQTIQDVELKKPAKVVFQKDVNGSARRWVEITVERITMDELVRPASEPHNGAQK
jgi:RNA polymerase sigma factor (sigma-70 family)